MDENMDEYNLYWETKMFLEVEELYGWGLESVLAECSSSGLIESQEEGLNSAAAFSSSSKSFSSAKPNTKMIVENRRNLNQRLYSLRSVVPNITKMNKSSILTDAIAYIQELQEQERSLMEETRQLGNMEDPTDHESCQTTNHDKVEYDEDMLRIKDKARCAADNIQVKVSEVGETTLVISITCSKKKDMILKLCQVLPSLNLKIITANIISFSGEIFHTIIIEGDEVDARWLEEKIEMSFAEADKIQTCLLQG